LRPGRQVQDGKGVIMNRVMIPNSFQTPNIIVDKALPLLSGAETKILLFIVRKTFGWGKEWDSISLSQFEEGCGLSRPSCIEAVAVLIANQIIIKVAKGQSFSYRLNLDWNGEFTGKESLLVKKVYQTGKESLPVTSKKTLHTETHSIKPTNINIPEAEKTASVNVAVIPKEKKPKEPAYRCNGYSWDNVHKDCEGHAVHVEMFKKTHLRDTGVPYADVKADYVNAARMHKVYGCQKLIDFQRRFWQLYRSEYDDVLAKKRLSFGVFISSIPTIIADLNQSDRDFVRREQRFDKKRAVA
jgi:hypothetical protein